MAQPPPTPSAMDDANQQPEGAEAVGRPPPRGTPPLPARPRHLPAVAQASPSAGARPRRPLPVSLLLAPGPDEGPDDPPPAHPHPRSRAHTANGTEVAPPALPAGRRQAAAELALRLKSPPPIAPAATLEWDATISSVGSATGHRAVDSGPKMGGSGLVEKDKAWFRPRANTAGPGTHHHDHAARSFESGFPYLGLLPSLQAATSRVPHDQPSCSGPSAQVSLHSSPALPQRTHTRQEGWMASSGASLSRYQLSRSDTSLHGLPAQGEEDTVRSVSPLMESAPVSMTKLIEANQLSKPTPYLWEKHKPVWTSCSIIQTHTTRRITTKMTQMMFECHFGELRQTEEIVLFRERMKWLLAKYQQRWLPFGQILASTDDVPFYYSQGTFPLFFRFNGLPQEPVSLFCTGRETLSWVIEEILRKSGRTNEKPEDKIVQFSGREAVYAFDKSVRLKDFTHVRNALKRREKLVLLIWNRCDCPHLDPDGYLERLSPSNCSEWTDDSSLGLGHERKEIYSVSRLKDRLFELKLLGIENWAVDTVSRITGGTKMDSCTVYVSMQLWYGEKPLCPAMRSRPSSTPPVWCEWIRTNIPLSNLPLESVCTLTVYIVNSLRDDSLELGTASCDVFDFRGWLMRGVNKLSLSENSNTPALLVEMERAPYPIGFAELPHYKPITKGRNFKIEGSPAPSAGDLMAIHKILHKGMLDEISDEEQLMLWQHRSHCFAFPSSLPKLLRSVPWHDPCAAKQAHRILENWDTLNPFIALQLLDRHYVDSVVREYAVHCLFGMSDGELVNHLLQLTQALKFERQHDSALARFLLYRALHNRTLVGHHFFWHLKAALSGGAIDQRYLILIQIYLDSSEEHADELFTQLELVSKLRQLNESVRAAKKTERTELLQQGLAAYSKFASFPQQFHLPINPQIIATGFVVDKCKVMDSNTAPLWLCFKNKDPFGCPVMAIFKEGDDLRQDVLVLQVFTEMDRLWKREGYDLHMTIYGVVSTALNEGFIEVVQRAATCSKIQKDAAGLAGALQRTPLSNWLQKNNQTEVDMGCAVQNFVLSCAAYSVASYVLGIGDRHNDNVMITREGHMFHIDFAHILGDFMKFGVYKREKAPFVFTDEFVHVMGGTGTDHFQQFVDLSCIAYNILRNNADILISLFFMMLSAGIPLLRTRKDINYLKSALALTLTEEEAAQTFTRLVTESLASKTTRVLFFMHNLAHPD